MIKKYLLPLLYVLSLDATHIAVEDIQNDDKTYLKDISEADKLLILAKEKKKKAQKQRYIRALDYFKDGDFENSYAILNNLFNETLDEPKINFFLGESAYATQRYHEATLAFQRVLFELPDNIGAKIGSVKVALVDKNYHQAEYILKELKERPSLPQKVEENVDSYLELIKSKKKRHFLSGVLMVGLGYDSNINNRSVEESIYYPAYNMFVQMSADIEGESHHQEIAILNYRYRYEDGINFLNKFMIYNKMLFDKEHEEKNVRVLSYEPTLKFTYENSNKLSFGATFNQVSINSKSYLNLYGFSTNFGYNLGVNSGYNLEHTLKYGKKKYQDSESSLKDSSTVELLTTLKYSYSNSLFFSGLTSLSSDIDESKTLFLNLNLTYIATKNLMITPSISWRDISYDEVDKSFLVKREEKTKEVDLSLTYLVGPKWMLQTGAKYIVQDSTIQIWEYNKYTFMLNIIRKF